MDNYQLYRTNHLLGGQIKWDLVLARAGKTLCVTDFHLTPISYNTPHTNLPDDYIVVNSHQDNIKNYYTKNKGNFYKSFINNEFTHNWPIICDDNKAIDSYSNTYDMGCVRSRHYDTYKKQFEFLCPLWLEKIDNDIRFEIEILNPGSKSILGKSSLILKTIENTNFHNKFIQYFNNYINEAGLVLGCDDVLSVTFNSETAKITGLNISNGLFETKNIDNIVQNITSRERPLMEIDNLLIQQFSDNLLICKQLFNFNLCFNLEDILSENIIKLLYGKQIIISVNTYIGDKKLDIKDFYTDYNYINKHISGDNNNYKENVLDYLKDNIYKGFIDKNKFCQSICHWSLAENNDYIFNVYNGFSGLYIDKDNIYVNDHNYCNAPNTYLKKEDKGQNATGWLNIKTITFWDEFYKYVAFPDTHKTEGTYINVKSGSNYINNLKYNYIPEININTDNNGVYVLGLYVTDQLLARIVDTYKLSPIFSGSDKVYKIIPNTNQNKLSNLILFLTSNINNLTFYNFYNNLYNKYKTNTPTESDNDLYSIYKMLASKIDPSVVVFNKSLVYTNDNNPDIAANEIDYIKVDKNSFNFVVRYDGKIKPTFTDLKSTLYYKDYISETNLKNSVYLKYNTLNYEPIYPSIGYCAIKLITDYNRDELPKVKVSNSINDVNIYSSEHEYKWFNNNKYFIINPEINFTCTKDYNNENDNDSLITKIKAYIQNLYNISNEEQINHIIKLYTVTYNWEYESNTNVKKYIYNISLKLKA